MASSIARWRVRMATTGTIKWRKMTAILNNSGAQAARGAVKWSPITIETREPRACIEIETHATLFSWSKWLAAWIASAYAQRRRRRHRTTWRPTSLHQVMQSWIIAYTFDIGRPYCVQLTAVISRYPLTSITWPYCGLRFRAHWGHGFFLSWPLINCWFFLGSAHVRLTCCKGSALDNTGVK